MVELDVARAPMASMAVGSLLLFLATSVLLALWVARSLDGASRSEDRSSATRAPVSTKDNAGGGKR